MGDGSHLPFGRIEICPGDRIHLRWPQNRISSDSAHFLVFAVWNGVPSLLITSGPASGKVCLTPTRAAIEATEAYRQTHNLGRGGGVTNGWEFWQPRT